MAYGTPTRVQGLQFALGSRKQTSQTTVSPTFNLWRKLNLEVPYLVPHTENDEAEIGKGNEFITEVFKTYIEPAPQRINKFTSAEWGLWAWCYALGSVTLATGLYTAVPINPGTTIEPLYFTIVAVLPAGGGYAIQEAQIGCAIESLTTSFKYGPGRASVTTDVEYVGLGVSIEGSGIPTIPASPLTESYLLSSSATVVINGVNFGGTGTNPNAMILSGTIGWKNNIILPMRYFPGSGIDSNGFATGGRMLMGARVPTFQFTALLDENSTEYALLVAQTQGTAAITFTYSGTEYLNFNWSAVQFEMVERKTEEGLIAVTVNVAPIYTSSLSSFFAVTGMCSITDIAQ
jgi:hypothetical protein